MKRHGASDYSNDCRAVSPGSYSASNIAGSVYGVSEDTLYRILRDRLRPRAFHRADRGQPRVMARAQLERYCELIAALKLRTSNRNGRHLSTSEAIRLVETYGVETPEGHVQAPASLLTKTTVNRYLKRWGYDHPTLLKQPPAVRCQAEHSNACWHVDLSPSDLKHVKAPVWMQDGRGRPLLMLYSVVDDRSGLAYQEYHGVYGEDVEAALRFLFAAMAPKDPETFPFQGIPHMLYTEYVPRNIFGIMWPFVLCGLTARWLVLSRWRSSVWPHNAYRDWSHCRSDGSSRQMGFPRHASAVSVDTSHAWSASAFIRSVISA